MKAITLKHPWAFAVARLGKDVENRRWSPSSSTLAPGDWLAIHGGVVPRGSAREEADDDKNWIGEHVDSRIDWFTLDRTITPGIVAACKFGGVVRESDSPWFSGPFGWLLEDVIAMPEPIPCRGNRGLWDLPEDVLARVRSHCLSAAGGVTS